MNDQQRSIDVGVLSGVGQSQPLRGLPELEVPTPYGATSTPVRVMEIAGRRVGLIARRGDEDVLQPHLVPYRANVWGLASLGARVLISSTASSSLRDVYPPGTFVLSDQLIDLTSGREHTFFDEGAAVQLSSAPMFDTTLRGLAKHALEGQGARVIDFGTTLVTNGPRFSGAAELRLFAGLGADLTNMVLMPEAALARELGLGVLNVSSVTDRADDSSGYSDGSELDFIRRRSAQSQAVLLQALQALVASIPAGFRAWSDVPEHRIAEVLGRPVPVIG